MKEQTAHRPYTQRRRAAAAEANTERILEAAHALFEERPWEQITFAAVAERAGVGTQTIIRRFGTKDGLARAVNAWVVAAGRGHARRARAARRPPTSPPRSRATTSAGARAIDRTLRQQDASPALAEAAAGGRAAHREWVERVFAPRSRCPRHHRPPDRHLRRRAVARAAPRRRPLRRRRARRGRRPHRRLLLPSTESHHGSHPRLHRRPPPGTCSRSSPACWSCSAAATTSTSAPARELLATARAAGFDASPADPAHRRRSRSTTTPRPRTPTSCARASHDMLRRGPLERADLERAIAEHDPDVAPRRLARLRRDRRRRGERAAVGDRRCRRCSPLPGKGIPPYGLGMKPMRGPLGRARDLVLSKLVERLYGARDAPAAQRACAPRPGCARCARPLEHLLAADRAAHPHRRPARVPAHATCPPRCAWPAPSCGTRRPTTATSPGSTSPATRGCS